jgi:enoyl-CoA hydratase
MDFSRYKYVLFERNGRVLNVALNRPDKLNAITGPFHRELTTLFADIGSDSETDIVVLTGAGSAFSAGGDLEYLEECRNNPAMFYEVLREARTIIMSLLDCDKPIVCRMNGDAVGLGATLALFCDIIIAADNARIGDPHVRVGYVAGDGGAVIWPQLVGYARAKQYLLTGDLISAKDAEAMGLINIAVPAVDLDKTVADWVARLSKGSPYAVRWTKATINTGLKQLAGSMMDAGLAYEGLSSRTEDHGEALKAMRERRKPDFRRR